jgi:muconolactone delta-isomerase
MYGPQLIEMAQVAEQEHMRSAMMARTRAQERRAARELRGPGRFNRAWVAFWAPRDFVLVRRTSVGDGGSTDLTPCTDC